MIWNPHTQTDRRSVLARQISLMLEACGGAEGLLADGNIEEFAISLDHALEERGMTDVVHTADIILFLVQALSSVGERRAARRLLVFGTGLAAPAAWDVTGDGPMWILDLRQMTVRDDCPIELLFFMCLSAILDAMAEVWDECDGNGLLGLRHVSLAASVLLGGGKPKQVRRMACEIKQRCRVMLERIAEERGWRTSPRVLDLDH